VKKAFPKSGVVELRKPTRGAILKGHGPVDGAGPPIEFVGEAPEIIMTKTLRPGRVGIRCHLSVDQSDDAGKVQQIWRTFFVRADGWRTAESEAIPLRGGNEGDAEVAERLPVPIAPDGWRNRKRFRYAGGTRAMLR
jgi:hypothetical protein